MVLSGYRMANISGANASQLITAQWLIGPGESNLIPPPESIYDSNALTAVELFGFDYVRLRQRSTRRP
jgi:hypothetical protein